MAVTEVGRTSADLARSPGDEDVATRSERRRHILDIRPQSQTNESSEDMLTAGSIEANTLSTSTFVTASTSASGLTSRAASPLPTVDVSSSGTIPAGMATPDRPARSNDYPPAAAVSPATNHRTPSRSMATPPPTRWSRRGIPPLTPTTPATMGSTSARFTAAATAAFTSAATAATAATAAAASAAPTAVPAAAAVPVAAGENSVPIPAGTPTLNVGRLTRRTLHNRTDEAEAEISSGNEAEAASAALRAVLGASQTGPDALFLRRRRTRNHLNRSRARSSTPPPVAHMAATLPRGPTATAGDAGAAMGVGHDASMRGRAGGFRWFEGLAGMTDDASGETLANVRAAVLGEGANHLQVRHSLMVRIRRITLAEGRGLARGSEHGART